jgi:hypothetical protein
MTSLLQMMGLAVYFNVSPVSECPCCVRERHPSLLPHPLPLVRSLWTAPRPGPGNGRFGLNNRAPPSDLTWRHLCVEWNIICIYVVLKPLPWKHLFFTYLYRWQLCQKSVFWSNLIHFFLTWRKSELGNKWEAYEISNRQGGNASVRDKGRKKKMLEQAFPLVEKKFCLTF